MVPEELITIAHSIQELKAETQTIEVKSAHKGCPKHLYDTLSSFSNQDEGGTIVFGLDESNGFASVGVYDVHDLQKKVAEQCKQMAPYVRPLFTVCEHDGHPIVSAEIPSIELSERPCYYRGKGKTKGSYKRIGDCDEPMTEYEIYSYEAFRKKYQDDIRAIPGCDLTSLNPVLLADYITRLKTNKPNLGQLDDEHIYRLMSIVKGDEVTLAAAWLFGLYPQAFIPQLCITAIVVPGKELGETGADGERFIDNKRIEGTIPDMLSEALSFVRSNMKSKTVIDPVSGKRTDVPEYPVVAVREVLLNALVHRDYSTHTEGMPIQLIMYADRLEVQNPGGLYGRLSIDQLGHVQPDTRNPVLATAMETLGLTENRYSGIPTIRKELHQAGLPKPEFVDTHDSFRVVLKKQEGPAPKIGAESEDDLMRFCLEPKSRSEIARFLGLSSTAYVTRVHIAPLIRKGYLAMTIPQKPRSKFQRYFTTGLGIDADML